MKGKGSIHDAGWVLKQIDLFVGGKKGYHTYRIPAIIVSTKGTILTFCEGRKYGRGDAGKIDIVLKRSLDNGDTWQPMRILVEEGLNTMGNPSPVVDHSTGVIWLLFCKNNILVYVMKSVDDGVTWSDPIEITKDVKKEDWYWYATGPCHGIQLKNGKLVIPCDHAEGPRVRGDMNYSHMIYSEDHGSSWKLGESIGPYMNECTLEETYDGSLYVNMRNYAPSPNDHVRAYAWSKDDGMTWTKVKFDKTLIEPICQASVIRFTGKDKHDKNRILFSNPASQEERVKMTIRLSYDECKTWPVSKLLNKGPSAYSDLAVAPNMTLCCLYERGEMSPYEKITFANFNIEWLTKGADYLNLARAP